MIEELNEKLTKYKEVAGLVKVMETLLIEDYKQIIRDTTIPLETRWDLFKNFPVDYHSTWIVGWVRTLDISLLDDWYVGRYETVDVRSQIIDDEDDEDSWVAKLTDEHKELILAEGYNTFENDW